MGLVLLIILILLLVGGLPSWNYSQNWGLRAEQFSRDHSRGGPDSGSSREVVMSQKRKKPVTKKVRILKIEKIAPDQHLIVREDTIEGLPDPPVEVVEPIEIEPTKEMPKKAFSIWKWLAGSRR